MRYTDEEVRPLTGSPNNGHTAAGATAGTAGPRSRKPPSSIGQHRGGRHGGGMEHFRSSKANEDFSKKPTDHHRRRSLLGYCTSCTSSAVAICCARPSTSTNSPFDYYEDTFNDEAWECTFGTSGQDGAWVNCGDQVGQIMSTTVWILMSYSVLTIMLLANHQNLPNTIAMAYGTVCALALASHAKTMFTDPGSIPAEAVPRATLFKQGVTTHSMCSHCQVYKPPNSHHCRICNRCISRMDHHCPWMNNCVGASNFKHFILFLCYTWIGCAFALIIFACNYFFCNSDDCTFDVVLVQLVRVMTVLCVFTLLFVSSMNVTYGVMTGVGTIDRLKKKASNTVLDSDEEPIALMDIFGMQGYWTWALPMDPIFEDYDRVMGYSIPQRLLREKQRDDFMRSTV